MASRQLATTAGKFGGTAVQSFPEAPSRDPGEKTDRRQSEGCYGVTMAVVLPVHLTFSP
jgi:hypothetical protein